MTNKEMELAIINLQNNVHDLASRPYTERAEKASGEARKAQADIEEVEREAAENLLAIVESLPE